MEMVSAVQFAEMLMIMATSITFVHAVTYLLYVIMVFSSWVDESVDDDPPTQFHYYGMMLPTLSAAIAEIIISAVGGFALITLITELIYPASPIHGSVVVALIAFGIVIGIYREMSNAKTPENFRTFFNDAYEKKQNDAEENDSEEGDTEE